MLTSGVLKLTPTQVKEHFVEVKNPSKSRAYTSFWVADLVKIIGLLHRNVFIIIEQASRLASHHLHRLARKSKRLNWSLLKLS